MKRNRIPSFLEPKSFLKVYMSNLPLPELTNWSKGPALINIDGSQVNGPMSLEIPTSLGLVWQPTEQKTKEIFGYGIFKSLVGGQELIINPETKAHLIEGEYMIHAHYGIKALLFLKNNWLTLPQSHKDYLTGKTIFGFSGTEVNEVGGYCAPYVTFRTKNPTFGWYGLERKWCDYEYALVDPRAPQIKNRPISEFLCPV
jgi:hypothetical protein